MKKRCLALLLALLMLCGGCRLPQAPKEGVLRVVTTIFPPCDFAGQIGGEWVETAQLLPAGTESHSYEPTPGDILLIQNADLFVYVGGESDAWVEHILDSMGERGPRMTLSLMACTETLEEQTLEGMQVRERDEHEQHPEYDEHVWTAPQGAKAICLALRDALSALDPAHTADYTARCAAYTEQLDALDRDFAALLAPGTTLVFGDRFPFRYFAEAYGLRCYAAFPGCSAETEPSAATVAFLVDKVREEHIGTIFYLELSNHRMADAIAEATGARTTMLHSCHNITGAEKRAGASYLSLMRQNYETLKEALS